jgi:hypothetical protein
MKTDTSFERGGFERQKRPERSWNDISRPVKELERHESI